MNVVLLLLGETAAVPCDAGGVSGGSGLQWQCSSVGRATVDGKVCAPLVAHAPLEFCMVMFFFACKSTGPVLGAPNPERYRSLYLVWVFGRSRYTPRWSKYQKQGCDLGWVLREAPMQHFLDCTFGPRPLTLNYFQTLKPQSLPRPCNVVPLW